MEKENFITKLDKIRAEKQAKEEKEFEAWKKKMKSENKTICPECGRGEIEYRMGRHGRFLGCSQYPRCKYSETINKK